MPPPPAAILALLTVLAAGLWVFRAYGRRRDRSRPLVERIDALLPQTQCQKCGYPGCRPYAEAIAAHRADINQCPPGGDPGIEALARLLGRSPKPLDERYGVHKDRAVAHIDESTCIGCTLCIQACPVDAILGAVKHMHTVIADECTGCELCLPPCPVDCISMQPAPIDPSSWRSAAFLAPRKQELRRAALAGQRFEARTQRLATEKREKAERQARHRASATATGNATATAQDPRKAAIQAALERTRAKKRVAAETKRQGRPLAE